jgi:uncharacterized protein (DUF488 family)
MTYPQKPEGYADGIEWLLENADKEVLCVMCMEANPNKCHRGDWIAVDLEKLGVKVIHLGWSDEPKDKDKQAQMTKFCVASAKY